MLNISYSGWLPWLDTRRAGVNEVPVVEEAKNVLTMLRPEDTARPWASRVLPIGRCTE